MKLAWKGFYDLALYMWRGIKEAAIAVYDFIVDALTEVFGPIEVNWSSFADTASDIFRKIQVWVATLGDRIKIFMMETKLNLSLAMAHQLGDKGVYVQAVLPGATRTEIWERSGKDIDSFPAEMVMSAENLVDASLAGQVEQLAPTVGEEALPAAAQ